MVFVNDLVSLSVPRLAPYELDFYLARSAILLFWFWERVAIFLS